MDLAASARLVAVLEDARQRGFVGPGDVDPHLAHAERFASAIGPIPKHALDLGSGAGLPGLVLATWWPTSRWVLLDANGRRAEFLQQAVATLGLADRVVVDHRRAEVAGRDPARRGIHDLVVARAFGPPAVVAECATPFLAIGGHLVVSEPPDHPDRWPDAGLALLALEHAEQVVPGFVRLRLTQRCADRYPRRAGVPGQRPRF
jgi:16S rRNA (guanine527-N7)-methyltransferase